MKAIIISPSVECSLSPLPINRRLCDLPVMGQPIINHTRRQLSSHGITDVTVFEELGTNNNLSDEEGLLAIESSILSDTDISEAIRAHKQSGADMTAVLLHSSTAVNLVTLRSDGMIDGLSGSGYLSVPSKYALEGIFIMTPAAAERISSAEKTLCGVELVKAALADDLKIYGYISDRASFRISTLDSYRECHKKILSNELPVRLPAVCIKDGFWLENGADLESGVKIETPVYISEGCRIERGAKIGCSFLGKGCTVKADASVSHAVIGEGCSVSENASVNGGILSDNVSLGFSSVVSENSAIGENCRIEAECTIHPGVRIWPNKRILRGTRLSDNLVWGSVGTERLFRNGKICGEVNVDVTPEFMAKLGAALGTVYRSGRIGLGYDSAPVCSMLASAIAAGLTSSGAKIFMFGEQSLPITRSGTRYYNLDMSLHINQNSGDGAFYPEIEFIEKSGVSFCTDSERRLENVFFNNVFFRAEAKNMHEASNLTGYKLFYVQEILNGLKSPHFSKNFEARTRSETISEILELLLGEIERFAAENAPKEFSADISRSGQQATFFTSDDKSLDNNRQLAIIAVVLLKHLGCRKIVLPVSASAHLEQIIKNAGGDIIYSGTSDEEFMRTILEHGLTDQFKMCFDGIFASVTLLDYLCCHNVNFDTLAEKIPSGARRETEIECPNSRKSEIINQLYSRYSDAKTDLTDGIKIYQSNGWVLVLPEKYRHCVKIITEGNSMEAADEISAVFTNQIKKLAKPE